MWRIEYWFVLVLGVVAVYWIYTMIRDYSTRGRLWGRSVWVSDVILQQTDVAIFNLITEWGLVVTNYADRAEILLDTDEEAPELMFIQRRSDWKMGRVLRIIDYSSVPHLIAKSLADWEKTESRSFEEMPGR